MKGIDSGKAFWQGVLGKISDPGLKTAAEQLMANPEVMTAVGNGVEGQAEIDRRLQELTAKTKELTDRQAAIDEKDGLLTKWQGDLAAWRTANTELVEVGKKAKAAGWNGGAPGVTPTVPAPVVPEGTATLDGVNDLLAKQAGEFLGFERDRQRLTREHFATFKEILDLDPLLAHPQVNTLGLVGVYQLIHKDALAAHTESLRKADEDRIRLDERQKVQAQTQNMPYPSVTGVNAGSPLDALKPVDGPGGPLVDMATAEYHRLQAARGASA